MIFKKFIYKKINSTNDIAIKKIKKRFSKGIIIAEEQKKGKGQYGRKWISQKGNFFISIFFRINKNIPINTITKINCSTIKGLLSKLIKKKISIKLPNDLLLNNKKICGILQETTIYNKYKYMIVGVGINLVNNPEIKNYPITNILKETGKKITILKLVEIIERNYKKKLKEFA